MQHATPVRRQLGFRTIFNLLGPISNPAGVRRQLLGIYSRHWIEPIAHVLAKLGTEKAWVVHGGDGLDEMTTTSTTHVAVLERGKAWQSDRLAGWLRNECSGADAGWAARQVAGGAAKLGCAG